MPLGAYLLPTLPSPVETEHPLLLTLPILGGSWHSLSHSFRICSWTVCHLPVLQRKQRVELPAGRRVPRRHEQPALPLLDLLLAQHVSVAPVPRPAPLGREDRPRPHLPLFDCPGT